MCVGSTFNYIFYTLLFGAANIINAPLIIIFIILFDKVTTRVIVGCPVHQLKALSD